MGSATIGNVLFTKTQQKVLSLLYGRPGKSFYTNEIIRLADMGKGTVRRELEKMLEAGLLTVTRIGNQNHYQANSNCPIYSELLSIVQKTFGIADVIRLILVQVDRQIDAAFVYGSVARGTDTADSDIDLLVVTESLPYAELMSLLVNAEKSLGRPINPSIYDMEQFRGKLAGGNAFLTKVMEQPKIWIKGTEDDIREPGKPGQDRETKGRSAESG